MQQFGKRLLALLLVLCAVVGFLPATAFSAAAETETKIVGQQLSLGDDLTMCFYASVGEEYVSNAVMNVEACGVSTDYAIKSMNANSDGNYEFYVSLSAAEMTEDITLTLTSGQTQLLQEVYSVQDYAHYLLENNYNNETKNLVKEMLNYGTKAQQYFDHKTGDPANAGYVLDETEERTIEETAPSIYLTGSVSNVSLYGCTMIFENKIAVRAYFTAPNGMTDCTVTVDGEPAEVRQKGSYYYIEIDGINPDKMDTLLNVRVARNEEELSFQYSPMYYITRMYKNAKNEGLKALVLAAKYYFDAAKVFTGIKEAHTGDLTLGYRYGTDSLIQVNTNLAADIPCVNFTADQNGCNIDQSANLYQQVAWIGMEQVNGTTVLTFHFNDKFEAGQTYVLPKGAVFGFTDGSRYTLDKNYTFTFDGSGWTMEAKEDPITLSYRWGEANKIQFNTNLPVSETNGDFTAAENGCTFIENGDTRVGWVGTANVDGTVVLTFNLSAAAAIGQSYNLGKDSVFVLDDGSRYQLEQDITLYWDGSKWIETVPVFPELSFNQYRWGNSDTIQVNTNLPSSTTCENFLAGANGCNITQGGDQLVGWIGMENVSGTIVLTFHFNNPFTAGQSYTLSAGSIFCFTDGTIYALDGDYTFTYDGSGWAMTSTAVKPVSLTYRYGEANLIRFDSDLPTSVPEGTFLATDNGSQIAQGGDHVASHFQTLKDKNGTIVFAAHFATGFAVGEKYTLAKDSLICLSGGGKYRLTEDVVLYWTGSGWSAEQPKITLSYSTGTDSSMTFTTNLPTTTPRVDFTTDKNGCNLIQGGKQSVGWIGMPAETTEVVLTFNFNSAFTFGQKYTLSAGSIFGFEDGSRYALAEDVELYWNGTTWTTEKTSEITLKYRDGTNGLIQFNTNLPTTTPRVDFTTDKNGCNLIQGGKQSVDRIGMPADTTEVVLTFNFNSAFTFGQKYTLSAGSVFGFTDGNKYTLTEEVTFYFDGSGWVSDEPTDVLEPGNFEGGKDIITFADMPVDGNDDTKLQEYVDLGFNTSLLTEDHTGALGPDKLYKVESTDMTHMVGDLTFQYRWGDSKTLQVNTNLPASTPLANFTADQNGCSIDQSGNTVQWVGWIGMDNVDGVIVLTFHFNNNFEAGQTYVLPAGAVFGFTDGNTYTLDGDYTFTWDGSTWSMEGLLTLSLNAVSAKYIQLKTNIPTGLTYDDFLLGDSSKGHNVILETTEGAANVAWFSYGIPDGADAVYLTFNFDGYNKPGTKYILKAGTKLKAGDNYYTLQQDYVMKYRNAYLESLENLNDAGLNVWIRNYYNTANYFTEDMTEALKLYQDLIDGFYMADEAFQTAALQDASGQKATTNFKDMVTLRDWFNTNFADKYFHANHVPITSYDHYTDANGKTLSTWDVESYKSFLADYESGVLDALDAPSGASIGFDNYPFIHAQVWGIGGTWESGIQKTYLVNTLAAAQVAKETGRDFSMCVQTFEAKDLNYNTSRDIKRASEVALQLYTGMAMGVDIFEYFAYNSNADFNGIMDLEGNKRIYDIVMEGNQALCFQDVVNTFTWDGIMTSVGTNNNKVGFRYVSGMVLSDSNNGVLSSVTSVHDAIIGCFTKDTLNGYMVVNFEDPAAVTDSNKVNLTFANCTRARVYTQTGGVLSSQVVNLTDGVYTATLAPGSACFVIPA